MTVFCYFTTRRTSLITSVTDADSGTRRRTFPTVLLLLVRGRYTITFKREDEELPPWILPPVAVAVEEEEEEEEEVPD